MEENVKSLKKEMEKELVHVEEDVKKPEKEAVKKLEKEVEKDIVNL